MCFWKHFTQPAHTYLSINLGGYFFIIFYSVWKTINVVNKITGDKLSGFIAQNFSMNQLGNNGDFVKSVLVKISKMGYRADPKEIAKVVQKFLL